MNPQNPVLFLNQLSLDLVAADFSDGHMPTQGGPTRTSRALAMIHLAMHDAFGALSGAFAPKLKSPPSAPIGVPSTDVTLAMAMAGAALEACRRLYPDQGDRIAAAAGDYRRAFGGGASGESPAEVFGIEVGRAWIAERSGDGSDLPGYYVPGDQPGFHRPDPHHPDQSFLHPGWGRIRPFVIGAVATDAVLGPPPTLDSPAYAAAFDEVVVKGRDTAHLASPAARQDAVTGIFWGYDGANKLGTPPRLYNQVVRQLIDGLAASGRVLSTANLLRLLTGINVAMADAGIAAWHWKYVYNVWRPVVGIREADPGTGPTGTGDGNHHRREAGDPFWCPLGAPRSNPDLGRGIRPETENFSPNFPAYPSGHAAFGSACFETASAILGSKPEDLRVTFVSDEFNGRSRDSRGVVRPRIERTFSLREAIEQNKASRIFLGVHWSFDATGGEEVGRAIAGIAAAAYGMVNTTSPGGCFPGSQSGGAGKS